MGVAAWEAHLSLLEGMEPLLEGLLRSGTAGEQQLGAVEASHCDGGGHGSAEELHHQRLGRLHVEGAPMGDLAKQRRLLAVRQVASSHL